MIHVFKSSSALPETMKLNADIIRENYIGGRYTNIMIDTNILISMESAYRTKFRHKALKDSGILDLVKMIGKSRKNNVFLSPAAAYQELPPSRRESVEAAFEKFLRDYLPNFRNDPNSKELPFSGGSSEPEPFAKLSSDLQVLISCSYASLMAMNIIDKLNDLGSIEKFTLYFDFCAEFLDLVSLKELTIARYVFAPEIGLTEEVRRRIVATRKNFLQLKKGVSKGLSSSEVAKRIALNGANDLKLISAADIVNNSSESFTFGEVEFDVWVATEDAKLFEFCRACPGFVGSERGGPLYRFVDTHADIRGTNYWSESIKIQERRLFERYMKALTPRSMAPIVDAARRLEALLERNSVTGYFMSRSWRLAPQTPPTSVAP